MTINDGRERARSAVMERMERAGISRRRLAADAGISPNTLRSFLAGETWPRTAQLAAIERVLGWAPGGIGQIADGGDVPLAEPMSRSVAGGEAAVTLGEPIDSEEVVVVFRPDMNLTPRDKELIVARLKAYGLELARQIEIENEQRERGQRVTP